MSYSRILFTIVLITTSALLHAQNKIQGYIIDKKTSEPLPYACIGAIQLQYGCYADSTGLFTLFFSNENDSVQVSYLGYKSLFVTVRDLKKNTKVCLEANPWQLKDVTVIPKKSKKKEFEIGFFKKKTVMLRVPAYPINIYTTFIPFPNKGSNVIIRSVKFVYAASPKNYPIRIRIFKANEKGEPGEDLVNDNIVFNSFKPQRALINSVANIDVSKYNITMPKNGVFIGIEWLCDGNLLNYKTKTWADGPYINSVKTGNTQQWINFNNNSHWGKTTNSYSLAIGLNVVAYYD